MQTRFTTHQIGNNKDKLRRSGKGEFCVTFHLKVCMSERTYFNAKPNPVANNKKFDKIT